MVSMRQFYIPFAALVLVNVVWNIFLCINPDRQTPYNYLFNVTYGLMFLLGVIIALVGSKKFSSVTNLRKSLIFYALSLSMYVAGLFIWAFYNLVIKTSIPYPSISDIFFVLFQPFSAIAFVFLIKSFNGKFTLSRLIELVILFVAFFGILYSFLLKGSLSEGLPFLTNALNVFYPAFDAFLVSLAITGIRTEGGNLHPNILIFAFAAIIMAFADTIFAYRTTQEIYWNGDIADTLFFVAASLFTIGIISISSAVPPPERA